MDSVVLAFQVYGLAILVSMAVALMIKGIVSALARVKVKQIAAPAAVKASTATIPEAHIAVIAAAAHAVLGAHRIVHVEDRTRGMAWTFEGRAAHHASHSVSRRPAR